ncbi:hypothetical protein QFC21_002350 [Naganishia friedmannii]|uniref:Uncharacterized protein n=1 Tax=Naganishia friedmannii TaxID=89922 RepID=A0ACC2VYD7_9TREE|nr:hypothetical protein QFC21_002350 [Naganishia friedmannii]
MVFDSLKLGQQTEGFWGAHTASIDWCEDNYTTSRYIAEFFNTISNVPFIAIGFYGWWRAMQTGLPQKYALPLLGLSAIGAGSFGFHMTLRWDWQLMDELPMIYEVMLCNLLVWDVDKRWGYRGIVAMLAFDVWHTAS